MSLYNVIDYLVVVDNNSTDNSWEKLYELRSTKVEVIVSDKNGGYAYGNNFGIRYAISKWPDIKYIIISNPDVYISEKNIEILVEYLNDDGNNVGVATGMSYNTSGKPFQNYGWYLPSFTARLCETELVMNKLYSSICNKRKRIRDFITNSDISITVDAVQGCFFIIKKQAFVEVNLFDEATFLYGEETILGYRLKELGYTLEVLKNVKFIHKQGVTINKNIKSYFTKSKLLMTSKIYIMKRYMKCNVVQILLYKMFYKLFEVEKYLYSKLFIGE